MSDHRIEGTNDGKLCRWYGEWFCESCHQTAQTRSLTHENTCASCGSADLTPVWQDIGMPDPAKTCQDIGDIVLTP